MACNPLAETLDSILVGCSRSQRIAPAFGSLSSYAQRDGWNGRSEWWSAHGERLQERLPPRNRRVEPWRRCRMTPGTA